MDYTVYRFSCQPLNPLSEILISHLEELSFESFEETKLGLNAYAPKDSVKVEQVAAILKGLSQIGSIEFDIEDIADRNWNASWEADYPPVEVGDACIVRAPFHKVTKEFPLQIIINPQMSFGTGHHETTFLMLKLLLELEFRGKTVMDIGSGTGVLAIAAKKLGAADVEAVDIEDWAFKNSLENASLNKVDIHISKGDASLLSEAAYDIILANINKNVLLADIIHYAKSLKTNGILLLSGFFTTDIGEIRTEAEKYHLKLSVQEDRNSWAALKFILSQ